MKRSIARDWSWHLAEASRQGITLTEYARRHRLSVSNLYMARHRQRRQDDALRDVGKHESERFVPVQINRPSIMAPSCSMSAVVRARLPNGVTIEFDAEALAASPSLLHALANLLCSG